MQLPAVFRRGIVVAENDNAEAVLSNWFIDESILVKYLSIDDVLFEKIYETKLFSQINSQCDSHIDDYEEDSIDFINVVIIENLVSQLLQTKTIDKDVKIFFRNFLELLDYANKNKRQIFFIL